MNRCALAVAVLVWLSATVLADTSSHEVIVWGKVQAVDATESTLLIETPRTHVTVVVSDRTLVRFADTEGRIGDLSAVSPSDA